MLHAHQVCGMMVVV